MSPFSLVMALLLTRSLWVRRDDSQGEATRPWAHLLCVHWDDAAWVNPEDLATMGPIRFHHRRLRAPANIR